MLSSGLAMATSVPLRPLGELAANHDSRRVPLSSRERAARQGSYPYYGAASVMDHVDDYLFEGLHLLIAEDGSVESPSGAPLLQLADGRFWVNNHAHVLKCQSRDDLKYLYYALRTVKVKPYLTGSVQAKLTQGNMNRIPVPFPSRGHREEIVAILGALDDKIENNRKMSATVEAMARTLFKSWFVDFDPVRAMARGQDPDLSVEIAALFHGSFEESAHGEIPSGWTFVTLLDIAKLNPEIWSKTTRPDVIRYVDLSTVKWGRFETPATYEDTEAPSRAQRVLRPGDTLVGTVRPANGSYGFVADQGLTGSTGFAVLRPTRSKPLTYLAATSKENIERLGRLADGGAYPAVRPEVVGETRVALPPDSVLVAFDAIASPLLDRYSQADRESRTLATLRDALLPKLISGELRLADAERALEKCT